MRTLVAGLLVLLLAGCTPSPAPAPSVTPTATPTLTATVEPQTFAVAGDSLTTADNMTFPTPHGDFAAEAWLHWMTDPDLTLVGGFAHQGYNARQVADNMPAVDADVLVVMVSTNDVSVTPLIRIMLSIDEIVRAAGVERVVLCAIPPVSDREDTSTAHNVALQQLAREREWEYLDPWVAFRTASGHWVDGASGDGIHPTGATAEAVAAAISEQMRS